MKQKINFKKSRGKSYESATYSIDQDVYDTTEKSSEKNLQSNTFIVKLETLKKKREGLSFKLRSSKSTK